MTHHANRFALFDPDGQPILNAVGIWTRRELVETYAGCVYGHDGTWAACEAEGYTIRLVTIVEAAHRTTADVDFLRAARRVLTEPSPVTEALAMAAVAVEALDRDPQMLRLAARILEQVERAGMRSCLSEGVA